MNQRRRVHCLCSLVHPRVCSLCVLLFASLSFASLLFFSFFLCYSVYTMTRLQNLSGSNLDATPQRNILSLYEVDKLTPAQIAAAKQREVAIAAEAQKQHQVHMLKLEQANKQRVDEQHRREEERQQKDMREQTAQQSLHQRLAQQLRPSHRKSDVGSANELVLNLASAGGEIDDDSDSDVLELEQDASGNSGGEVEAGAGRGRVHLQGQLHDHDSEQVELSVSNNDIDKEPAHFVYGQQEHKQ